MTAPDPGLTDLIAAHTLRVVELNEAVRYPECNGCDWVGGLVRDHAAHVALVVEQHANGRTAELEAELAEVTDKWGLISHHYRKAEAAIARVRDALTIGPLHRLDFPKYKDPYAIDRHVIRAALEGEQQ